MTASLAVPTQAPTWDFERAYAEWRGPLIGFLTERTRDAAAAEDLAHEALLRAWTHRDMFDGRNLGGWLHRIAHHTFVDAYRRAAVRPAEVKPVEALSRTQEPVTDETPERVALLRGLGAEALALAGAAFESLLRRHKLWLWLFEYEGLSYENLMVRMGRPGVPLSESSVKGHLYRARQAMDDAVRWEHACIAAGSGAARRLASIAQRGRSPDECWAWHGYIAPTGYAQIATRSRYAGRTGGMAQRLACALAHGPVSPFLYVVHRGSNPVCTNPAHLYLARRVGLGGGGSRHVPVEPDVLVGAA